MPGRLSPEERQKLAQVRAELAGVKRHAGSLFLSSESKPKDLRRNPLAAGEAQSATSVASALPCFSDWCTSMLHALEQSAAGPSFTGSDFLGIGSCLPTGRLLGVGPVRSLGVGISIGGKARVSRFAIEDEETTVSDRLRQVNRQVFIKAAPLVASANAAFHGLTARLLNQSYRVQMCGMLASVLTPMAVGGAATLATGGTVVAFCPPCLPEGGYDEFYNELSKIQNRILPANLADLERCVTLATAAQGTLGLTKIYLGDQFSGFYTLLLATLGYNSRTPGPNANWLKTYVLISFINGTMSSMDLLQQFLSAQLPFFTLALPFATNLAHAATLLTPFVSFGGAYFGWNHVKMQRRYQMDNYQKQIEHMLQNPPWPPPPLPPQIIESMMRYSIANLNETDVAQLEGQLQPEQAQALRQMVTVQRAREMEEEHQQGVPGG